VFDSVRVVNTVLVELFDLNSKDELLFTELQSESLSQS
jgi:hypothetical protein